MYFTSHLTSIIGASGIEIPRLAWCSHVSYVSVIWDKSTSSEMGQITQVAVVLYSDEVHAYPSTTSFTDTGWHSRNGDFQPPPPKSSACLSPRHHWLTTLARAMLPLWTPGSVAETQHVNNVGADLPIAQVDSSTTLTSQSPLQAASDSQHQQSWFILAAK